eukprot:SAG31_NODE_2777_length_5104_cov_3.012587_1_plen_87_part_00
MAGHSYPLSILYSRVQINLNLVYIVLNLAIDRMRHLLIIYHTKFSMWLLNFGGDCNGDILNNSGGAVTGRTKFSMLNEVTRVRYRY